MIFDGAQEEASHLFQKTHSGILLAMHASIQQLRDEFFAARGGESQELSHWHFCDNEQEANELLALALAGEKRATAPSLWWFEASKEPLPQQGEFEIVTDWAGVARCVIEITRVDIVPFNEVTAEFAREEGEGDKSLEYWRRVHWDYYQRELRGTENDPKPDMPIVCIRFRVAHEA